MLLGFVLFFANFFMQHLCINSFYAQKIVKYYQILLLISYTHSMSAYNDVQKVDTSVTFTAQIYHLSTLFYHSYLKFLVIFFHKLLSSKNHNQNIYLLFLHTKFQYLQKWSTILLVMVFLISLILSFENFIMVIFSQKTLFILFMR